MTAAVPTTQATLAHHHHHDHHHNRDGDSGPYRDEDALSTLPLLASKYPHVRQAFHKPKTKLAQAEGTATWYRRVVRDR
jgi:hypothetical protein